jgi:UDP-N-acetylglucosamine acyltransferase
VNSIGLKRRGYTNEQVQNIQDVYRELFLKSRPFNKALAYIESNINVTDERDEIVTFVRESKRGVMKGYNAKSHNGE